MPARALWAAAAAAAFAIVVVAGTNGPGSAASYPSACPSMGDSVTRLYDAFFQREPDAEGYEYWTTLYANGTLNLEQIADAFVASSEHAPNRTSSNQEFVDWLYGGVLGPDVVPARTGEWVAALDAGYGRGAAVISFTESRNFVERTSTARPLAGYLRWYPVGTHWYCGRGTTTIPLHSALTAAEQSADYYFQNRGNADDTVGLWTNLPLGRRHVQMVEQTLAPGFTEYNWDGAFTGDGEYGTHLEVRAGPQTDWIVVFYPRSIGEQRLGWELG